MAGSTRVWCDSTSCPAAISCALHWSRSPNLAAERKAGCLRTPRGHDPVQGHSAEYKCDVPRAWLLSPYELGRLQAVTALLLAIVNMLITDARRQAAAVAGDG